MRVYLTSHHAYPARIQGAAGCRVIDNIAKGLAELGHETTIIWEAEFLKRSRREFGRPMGRFRKQTFGMCRIQIPMASLRALFLGKNVPLKRAFASHGS